MNLNQQNNEQMDRQDQLQRKRLYREELLRMIDEQKEKKLAESQVTYANEIIYKNDDEQKRNDLRIRARESVNVSLENDKEKKNRLYMEQQRLVNEERQLAERLRYEGQEEDRNRFLTKDRVRRDLQSSYQETENRKRFDLHIQQQKDRDIGEQENQRLMRQEQDRNQLLFKMKSGYNNQNYEVLTRFNEIQYEKDQKEREWQRKHIEESRQEKMYQEQMIQNERQQQNYSRNKETANTMLNQINEKQMQVKQNEETKKYDRYLIKNDKKKKQIDYQQQIKQDKEIEQRRKQQYQEELLKQIEQDRFSKGKNSKLTEESQNYFNYSVGAVPGSSNQPNFERKQREYAAMQMNENQDNFSRPRNISAYQAGQYVISTYDIPKYQI